MIGGYRAYFKVFKVGLSGTNNDWEELGYIGSGLL